MTGFLKGLANFISTNMKSSKKHYNPRFVDKRYNRLSDQGTEITGESIHKKRMRGEM